MKFTITNKFEKRRGGQTTFAHRDFRVELKSESETSIYVYDDIGPGWLGMIDALSVKDALDELGSGTANVFINSRGGDAFEGLTIYNVLRRFARKEGNRVNVNVDGLAASAASLVAIAGDSVAMASNALMMIHRAFTLAWGNATELSEISAILEKIDGRIAATYAQRADGSEKHFLELMDAETWFTADEAIEEGLADAKAAESELDVAAADPPRWWAGWGPLGEPDLVDERGGVPVPPGAARSLLRDIAAQQAEPPAKPFQAATAAHSSVRSLDQCLVEAERRRREIRNRYVE